MELSLLNPLLSIDIDFDRPIIFMMNNFNCCRLKNIGMKTINNDIKKVKINSFFSLNPFETKKGKITIGMDINLAPIDKAHTIPETKTKSF